MPRFLIPLLLVGGLVGPLFGLNWYSYDTEWDQHEQTFEEETRRIATTLANGVSGPVWNLIPEAGRAIVRSLMQDPRILRIEITTDQEKIFLEEGAPKPLSPPMQSVVIRRQGMPIGKATVYFSNGLLRQAQDEIWNFHFSIAVVQLAFAVLIAGFVLRLNTRLETARHREEEAQRLGEVEQTFVEALEDVTVALALFDEDERLVFCNTAWRPPSPGALKVLKRGVAFEDFLRVRAAEGDIPVEAEGDGDAWVKSRIARFRNAPVIFETKFGDDWFQVMDQKLPKGGTLTFGINITERKELERQLQASQKLEAIGQLTGGIAHDFNNILSILLGNAELLEDLVEPGSQEQETVRFILRAVERGASLTSRLLAYSRRQVLTPVPVILESYIAGLEELLQRALGATITLEVHHADNLWPVMIDHHELENAVINLAINARDAMPGGGRLDIEMENVSLDDEAVTRYEELKPGDYVEISVSDTGVGMSENVIERAREPFFTTKEAGKGSGLGLSMVYGFIKQSHGHLTIYSEPGHGTTIRMYLPRSDEQIDGVGMEREIRDLAPGEGRILVVEDDPDIRRIASRILRDHGYDVAEADNGPDAISLLVQSGPFDLLFTDLVLPGGMTGTEIAAEAKRLQPGIAVLYTTGYTENAVVHNGRLDAGLKLIRKPHNRRELLTAIQETLKDRD
jgi:signal transduction histidine kinase/ActR/RegA family two-component response regulator